MKRINNVQNNLEELKDVYVGIDVHKNSWTVSVRTANLALKTFTLSDPTPQMLHKTLVSQFPGSRYHLVYEAGFSGYALYEYFKKEGIDITVTPPNRIPTDHSRVKTDKMDSRKLAKFLIGGLLKEVKVPPNKVQHYRMMFTILDKIKSQRIQIINQLKGILYFFNHPLRMEKWSSRLQSQLELIEFPVEVFNTIFHQQLEYLKNLKQHIIQIEKQIKVVAEDPQYAATIKHLTSIKGISLLSAIRLTAFLFDRPDRFTSSEHICSYVGLTPSEHSSGDKERRGHISRIGNKQLRALLVQMTWVAVRHDGDLLMKFEDLLSKGKSKQQAIIAVARKFLVKIYQSLKKGEPYDPHLGLPVSPESIKELPTVPEN